MAQPITPETTLVVILGASKWPHSSLSGNSAFKHSAEDVAAYFLDPYGFGLPEENCRSYFDKELNPGPMMIDLGHFIQERTEDANIRDIFVYFVGHGNYYGPRSDYYLEIKASTTDYEEVTSLSMDSLAGTIKRNARYQRRFLILDSCFSGAANRSFMQAEMAKVAVAKTAKAFPGLGTLIFCSSGREDPSLAPPGQRHTLFSGSLLGALRQGIAKAGSKLSMADMYHLVRQQIEKTVPPEDFVQPELHSPQQEQGDLRELSIFPNPAQNQSTVTRTERRFCYGQLRVSSSRGGQFFLDGLAISTLAKFEGFLDGKIKAGTHQQKFWQTASRKSRKRSLSVRINASNATMTLAQ